MTTDLFNILSKNQFPLSKWVWIIIIIIATLLLIAGFIVLEFNLQFESIPTINKNSLRKSWFCDNCDNFLFYSSDIIMMP